MVPFPSPCLDICKYKLRGQCIACGMSKMQKRAYESLRDPEAQKAFIEDLMQQQARIGSAKTWAQEYARLCERLGVASPFRLSSD